jgi:serine/threonine protein kinase
MKTKKYERIKQSEIAAKDFCKKQSYKFIERIGAGGNGTVFKIEKTGKEYALKIVSPKDKKEQARFDSEIQTMNNYQGKGIVPIITSGKETNYQYYLMPCLLALDKYIFKSIDEKIQCITKIANILTTLSKNNIFHRDLKPGNIVIDPRNNEIFLIDLGLVKNSQLPINVTSTTEHLGSFSFMAPERINTINAKTIDNEKSDVYSFGMIAWSIITEQSKGFFGTYLRNDDKNSFSHFNIDFRGRSIIEDLITSCTVLNPEQRPSFSEIANILNKYKNNNLEITDFYSDSIFSLEEHIPDYVIWTNIDDIAKVLEHVIQRRFGLEILLPDGSGWLNLENVKKSETYPDFIEIYANSALHPPILIAPNYLFLAMFKDHPIYVIEAKKFPKLHKAMSYDDDSIDWEQTLTQLSPFNFTYEQCAINNDYDGNDLPKGSTVFSFINNGKFLLHPIDQKTTNSQLIEQLWEENNDEFDIKFPFYEKQDVDNINRYVFHEVTHFKSKKELLKQSQINEIENLIFYIFNNQTEEDRISTQQIVDYCNGSNNSRMLLNYLEAADDLSLYNFPFYPMLSTILFKAERNKGNQHLINHPEHSGFRLIKQLYHFIYCYSENPIIDESRKNEIQQKEQNFHQKEHEKMQKIIEKFSNRSIEKK